MDIKKGINVTIYQIGIIRYTYGVYDLNSENDESIQNTSDDSQSTST